MQQVSIAAPAKWWRSSKPLSRISGTDLDRLMGTMEVASAQLSECLFATEARLHIERTNLPTIHYGLTGSGTILIEGEAAFELAPKMLVVAPPNKSIDIIAAGPSFGRLRNCTGSIKKNCFVPGSVHRHEIGEGEASFSLVCGHFHAIYGPGLDPFASLASPIAERFDAHGQVDHLINYAMMELAGREIGGQPMVSTLFKLVLLALLRRSLTSTNAWVESFSLLNDPPIARAFAEMASRPAANFRVETLCSSVGLSRSVFMARFAAAFGDSPMSVLRRLRMRHAAGLLAANALSIEQVAFQAGYRSRSSFSRVFRKHYGIDPSDYRAEAKRAVVTYEVERSGALNDYPPLAIKVA
ncbi:helix-turn-helix transcriptional regulator [Dongia soli]|uniref:AraC family transcriptional regulator n=1 Tax=Dongia soli TaxID=600628 RepID=A0ABU5EHM6_9PROT|nr:AraC family transcriptional regulator [Dongia soli]MDY0885913.1 AraC family transcriptional regulator [Dongia soli]